MDNLNLFHELETLLRTDSRYCMDDGTLIKNKIVSDALSLNPELLKYLLSHESLKKNFFSELEGILIFDKVKFQQFVMNKSFLPDSYTAYKNKIGLTSDEGRFISESREVVLAWPYKDCMLEGGQTKEDAKRNEIFWSETLAPDEINRLTEPKAFTGFKRYDKEGEHDVEHLQPTDNLIIKGNNLLALYSLRKKFAGRIKLIYIDPPYNTGNDSFGYNDKFKHSTWLTFMRNRLLVAKELLKSDGMIFVSINHLELGYLLVLMDDIMGKENRLPISTLKVGTTASYRSINECPVNVTEYVVGYTKQSDTKVNKVYIEASYSEDYSHYIVNMSDNVKDWKLIPILDAICLEDTSFSVENSKKILGNLWVMYKFYRMSDFAMRHADSVVSLNTLQKPSKEIENILTLSRENRGKVFECKRNGNSSIYCYNGRSLAFYSGKIRDVGGKMKPSEILTNLWSDISFLGIGPEGGVTLANGKKPEALIERILRLATKERDIVLDFHVGSGTTAAVAHKMNRQYIGVEQLDYKENDSVIRLKNVINGDRSGISNSVKWKGGGSFVYCELAKANQLFVEDIEAAETCEELTVIWQRMQATDYLNYKINISNIDENITDFASLSLDDQKRFLIECLDKNMLYIPVSDMESEEYVISEEDKRLTKEFYKK